MQRTITYYGTDNNRASGPLESDSLGIGQEIATPAASSNAASFVASKPAATPSTMSRSECSPSRIIDTFGVGFLSWGLTVSTSIMAALLTSSGTPEESNAATNSSRAF